MHTTFKMDTAPSASAPVTAAAPETVDLWSRLPEPLTFPWAPLAGVMCTAAATACGHVLSHHLPIQGLSLIYLLAILLGAVGFGVWTGMTAAVLSFLAFNFFFIPPTYTFTIAEPREVFALIVFFVVALITGSLAGRMREVTDRARQTSASLQSLNAFAGDLSGARTEEAVLQALVTQAAKNAGGPAIVLTTSGDKLKAAAAVPPVQDLQSADWQAAARAVRSAESAYPSAPGWPGARYEFHPIASSHGVSGVLGLAHASDGRLASAGSEVLIQAMLRHASIALDRTRLELESAAIREEAERERLRSALISSLSHDLRTPLASILGSVTSLREFGPKMSEATRADLLLAIEEETGRLSQFVANLLDLTRLDTETPDLRRDWLDAGDAANIAVTRIRKLFPALEITFSIANTLPLVRGDTILFEHVVFNLLDNAVKFSGGRPVISVEMASTATSLVLCVTDEGPGIPPDQLPHIFDKFYRSHRGDRDAPGTGLGLTICKRVVEGMAGTIVAQSPIAGDQGTRIVVQLPIPERPLAGEETNES
ncbi:MAG: DUF4118 domain-containing protein [Hyphomicrobium sp.]